MSVQWFGLEPNVDGLLDHGCLGGGPEPWHCTSPPGGSVPRHALPVLSWHSHLTRPHVSVHGVVGQGSCLVCPT